MAGGSTSLPLDWLARFHDALDVMRDDPVSGRQLAVALVEDARAAADEAAYLGGRLTAAYADFYHSSMETAESEFMTLSARFRGTHDRAGEALAVFGTILIWRSRGRTRDAYELGHARLLPLLPESPTRETVLALNGMGIVAQEFGLTEEALRHFYGALDAARLLGLPSRVAQITANIGETFYVSGNAEDAEEMLVEARQLAGTSKERWLAPFVSTVLALSKLSLGKYDEAYEAIAEYVGDYEQRPVSDIANRVFCLSVAAYMLAMRDKLDEAERLSALAIGLIDRFEDKQLKPYAWWVSGHLHHRRGRSQQAIADLKRAVEAVGDLGYVFMPLRALEELSQIYAELGDWETAFREHRRYHALFERAQDQAARVRVQTIRIRQELKEAELARRHAEQTVMERKRLEDGLKQKLAERDSILENSLVGIGLLTEDSRVQWANRALVQMFGADEADFIGKPLETYYRSHDDYLRIGSEIRSVILSGKPYEGELPMRRVDGTYFWAALSGRAVNPQDLSHGMVWAVMDITKRRQLEEDLGKSEEHHRQVVNNVTECILVVQGGHIVFSNPRVSELTGYSPEDLAAVLFTECIHPEDREMVLDRHRRRLRGEAVDQYYQFRVINRVTAAEVWVELSAVMIEWEGKPATLSFMTDVTERRHLEESLKRSMQESMRLQTLQIQNELREAERARHHAEETTRAKSMFLANMSHEIRTPMNAIIGMAHLALRTELDRKQRDYLEKIHGAGKSLLGIINDILDVSKIEAGRLEMETVEFDLDDVVNHASTLTSAKAEEKGLEYLFEVPPEVPRKLLGDPLRLGQVLINLINNAIKFTESGEIHVACRRRALSGEGGKLELEFSVRDTGIGMNREQAERLFHPFSQADESTTRRYGGTGLGLSICKAMVELMGGRIWLDSAPGAGTTMHFTAWFGVQPEERAAGVTPASLNGMRVLVVDDNPMARRIMADSLSALPVTVDMAAGGEEALAAICAQDAASPYGVVFTDLRMPDMDGIDLIARVRRDARLRSPPRMVLVSAYAREEVRYREEGLCADGFLMKPVNASVMVDTLVDLFSPARRAAAPPAPNEIPRFRGLSVLLAEDNEINQQIAVELMEAAGVTVAVADNGRTAVEMLLAAGPGHYGLVLMDVQMPDMDGHEATRRIRADARFSGLPIVAITAHAMAEEKERCLASGMNDHLAKPVNPIELYHALLRWCPSYIQAEGSDPLPIPALPAGQALTIEGVDVADGLARTLGNRDFYLQMLDRFREAQRDTPAQIRRALGEGTAEGRRQAERLAHTLKGVAGQVGAKRLQSVAGDMEEAIRSGGAADLGPPLERLEGEMIMLQAALERALSPRADKQSAPAADRATIGETLQRVAALLRDYDGEAVDVLTEVDAVLQQALGSEIHKRIARAARQYDYDGALAALVSGAQAIGYRV